MFLVEILSKLWSAQVAPLFGDPEKLRLAVLEWLATLKALAAKTETRLDDAAVFVLGIVANDASLWAIFVAAVGRLKGGDTVETPEVKAAAAQVAEAAGLETSAVLGAMAALAK